jgi:ornithine carbamoyltransferase
MKRDFISEYDLKPADFDNLLARAGHLKSLTRQRIPYAPLKGMTLGMIFDKSSTRTRISFEVGMYQLGGLAIYLSNRDMQMGRGESIADSALVLSRYLDVVVIRTGRHQDVLDFAAAATIPVINGLTDFLHPCQILSDLFTITEKLGSYEGVHIAYVGDGNNVANSWLNAAARLPLRLTLACPEGYDPDAAILERARKEAPLGVKLTRNPEEAVAGAQVVYTDTFASMGWEAEKKERSKIFAPYQVDQKLMSLTGRNAYFMHCLPAYRGEEVTGEVLDGPGSIVYDQAENRLHTQKAILEMLLKASE